MSRRLEIILQVVSKGITVDREGNVFNNKRPFKLRVGTGGYYRFKLKYNEESNDIR
jgi:hypothetical protein